jgi:signal transduction histidine kinase
MKSLSARLTLWYALVVTLTVAALLLLGRFYLEHNMVSAIDLLNEVEFEEIRSRIDDENSTNSQAALIEAIKEHAELDAALYFFQVGHAHGDVLYKSSNMGPYKLPKEVHGHPRMTVRDDELGLIRTLEVEYAGLDIHVVSSLNSAEALFKNYERTGFYLCGGIFIFSLALGYFLSRLAIRPIATIQASAQRVSASNFNERIPVPNTGDEIERMAVLLNAMLDRLEAAYEQVKRFTAEASHEFRTPLSIIRLQTERLLERPELTTEERVAALDEQMEEVERLNKMIDDLLFLAKADAGVLPLSVKQVNVEEFLSDFKADAELLAEGEEVHFKLKSSVEGEWPMDANRIRQVLLNLLSNALTVSPKGAEVELVVTAEAGALGLSILDQGAGLKDSEIARMFNRFERLGATSESRGNGLGLAICRSIVERHGGTIHAENRKGAKGLAVVVRIPEHPKGESTG